MRPAAPSVLYLRSLCGDKILHGSDLSSPLRPHSLAREPIVMAKKKKLAGGTKTSRRVKRKVLRAKPARSGPQKAVDPPDPPGDDPDAPTQSSQEPSKSKPGFAVVGIGASAGGLEAFTRFFSAMPPASGMAFVLIQHLDPTHESLTSELLARHTKMPVVQATDNVEIEPDHVYVIPPNRYLAISGVKLRLSAPLERRGLRVPIDFFFRSLAEEQREGAIGVLLSGTGSDGTSGVREIKAAGGMVIVQAPETTAWDGMLRSAIATGVVDHILPVEKMPAVLTRYVKHWYVNGDGAPRPMAEKGPDHLKTIVGILRARARYDFSCYKPGTLLRRIQRRMGLSHIQEMGDYVEYLRHNHGEVTALFKDMLISVTSFFREPKAWEGLERQVIEPLVSPRSKGMSVRAWVPGCATGEEAYSLAMLILKHAEQQDKSFDVNVFASDIDREGLAFARAGVYPESIAADVPRDLLRRYFVKGEHTYRVCKELRDIVVFAEQNVISDPPFSKLDLISCRNVLIYLESDVQNKIFGLFHFALLEGGSLFLGSNETINQLDELFEPASRKLRIYRRVGGPRPDHPELHDHSGEKASPKRRAVPETQEPRSRRLTMTAQQILVQRFAPACVVVKGQSEVVYLHGAVDQYLQLPVGEPGTDLVAMAREGLRSKLRAALQEAVREGHRVTAGGISLKRNGGYATVRVTVEPEKREIGREAMVLVIFEDEEQPSRSKPPVVPPPSPSEAPENDHERVIAQLEEHLRATREELQGTIEELQTSNEEFKAANEEVTSMNEELQSTNEELETSKEELQSLNEEMQTVNQQLEQKLAELDSTNNDLINLLSTSDIATILLDRRLRLKRFTRATARLLPVIESDIGRPISDFAQNFTDVDLLSDAQRVLKSLTPIIKEIPGEEGRSYLRQIVPYRTQDDRIDGVVVTFADVTERNAREQILTDYNVRLENEVAERTAHNEQQSRDLANLEDRERQRLGRELHDTLGQQLTAVGVLAATLREQQASASPRADVLDKLETSIDEAKRQIRALARGLFPVDVDKQGLRIALDELAKETTSIFGISCQFQGEPGIALEDNFTATQLFLIAREAVQNAARHADATRVVIELNDGEGLQLSVEDNGRGMPDEVDANSGMGLKIMRHRSDLVGGTLAIESSDGHGTRVDLHMPKVSYRARDAAE
jgi:two-component system CheB/CheR fusion protein